MWLRAAVRRNYKAIHEYYTWQLTEAYKVLSLKLTLLLIEIDFVASVNHFTAQVISQKTKHRQFDSFIKSVASQGATLISVKK